MVSDYLQTDLKTASPVKKLLLFFTPCHMQYADKTAIEDLIKFLAAIFSLLCLLLNKGQKNSNPPEWVCEVQTSL